MMDDSNERDGWMIDWRSRDGGGGGNWQLWSWSWSWKASQCSRYLVAAAGHCTQHLRQELDMLDGDGSTQTYFGAIIVQ